MDPDSSPYTVELTRLAEEQFENYRRWRRFLARAIDELAADPEPDGLTKFVASSDSRYVGNVIYEVGPFWIVYQLVGPNRVVSISITPQPYAL